MTAQRHPAALGRRLRAAACLASLVALALVVGALSGAGRPTDARPAAQTVAAGPEPVSTPIKFVQANIYKELSTAKFEQDVAKVYAENPDIITFNEVGVRDSATLAPPGYQLWRTPGHRTGWSPVAWRKSKWTDVGHGTWQISDTPERLRDQPGIIGVRYANWVTLMNAQGQKVSVISTHIAPKNANTAELLVPSLKRLAELARTLRARGAVLMGGDFNMGYHSSRYQPQYLSAVGLTNTFEILGTSFPTHRGGGTIDYIFLGPLNGWIVESQQGVAMNSDHLMLVARLRLTTPASGVVPPTFKARTITVPVNSRTTVRRSVRTEQLAAVAATPGGAAIHVASGQIRGDGLLNALIRAHQRGVHVTVITNKHRLSGLDKVLADRLGSRRTRSSYYVQLDRQWRSDGSPNPRRPVRLDPTVLLISLAGATPAYAMRSNSPMSLAPTRPGYPRPTTARVTTSKTAYDQIYRTYLAAIGRTL